MENIKKPDAPILGADGNVFNLLAICSRALKDANLEQQADEMSQRVQSSDSYQQALSVMLEYIDPIEEGYELTSEKKLEPEFELDM